MNKLTNRRRSVTSTSVSLARDLNHEVYLGSGAVLVACKVMPRPDAAENCNSVFTVNYQGSERAI